MLMKKVFTLLSMVLAASLVVGATTFTKKGTPVLAKKASKAAVVAEATTHAFPTGEYKSLGKGLYTDDMLLPMYSYQPMTWEVEIQQSVDDPNFYRVISPYGQAFADAMLTTNGVQLKDTEYDKAGTTKLDIDATDPDNVYFAKTMLGLNWGYGEAYIGIPTSKSVTFKDGIFSAPVNGVAVGDDDGAYAMNKNQKFRIVLPGVQAKDYELTLTFDSQCLSERVVKGSVSVGSDIAAVKYGLFANLQEDEISGLLADIAEGGANFAFRGDFQYTMSQNDKETMILVGVDKDGKQVSYVWETYYFIDNDATAWEDCGTAILNAGFLKSLYSVDDEALEVALQRNVTNPRLIRLVDPYAKSKYYSASQHSKDHKHYLTIEASDAECIYIKEGPLGLDFGNGLVRISSMAEYFLGAGYEMSDVKELECGATLTDDNTLTFPEESILLAALKLENGDWYTVGNADTSIKLPADFNLLGVSDITVDESNDAPARIYNLQGIPVNNPEAGQVYIVVRGNRSAKVVF